MHLFPTNAEHALGSFGLLLMLLIARLASPAYVPARTRAGRARGFLARRAIDTVALVGWLADRLPPPDYAAPRAAPGRDAGASCHSAPHHSVRAARG